MIRAVRLSGFDRTRCAGLKLSKVLTLINLQPNVCRYRFRMSPDQAVMRIKELKGLIKDRWFCALNLYCSLDFAEWEKGFELFFASDYGLTPKKWAL